MLPSKWPTRQFVSSSVLGLRKIALCGIIAGLESPTSGTVRIGGRIVNDVAPKDRDHRDGVPELRPVSAHDGRENLSFSLKLRAVAR